jgi:hypothetical protein
MRHNLACHLHLPLWHSIDTKVPTVRSIAADGADQRFKLHHNLGDGYRGSKCPAIDSQRLPYLLQTSYRPLTCNLTTGFSSYEALDAHKNFFEQSENASDGTNTVKDYRDSIFQHSLLGKDMHTRNFEGHPELASLTTYPSSKTGIPVDTFSHSADSAIAVSLYLADNINYSYFGSQLAARSLPISDEMRDNTMVVRANVHRPENQLDGLFAS